MHNYSSEIRSYMERTNQNQEELAHAAAVSQPTVSRALNGATQRHGRGLRKLIAFIRSKKMEKPTGPKRIIIAFKKIWDGSEAHATAVARIIEDLAELKPTPALRRRIEQRKRA